MKCGLFYSERFLFGVVAIPIYRQRWECNFKNVAPQKQNTICKLRAQFSKLNCAFELFKAHCAAIINAKNASFHKNCKALRTQTEDVNLELQITKHST
jgi:hypothetical protein